VDLKIPAGIIGGILIILIVFYIVPVLEIRDGLRVPFGFNDPYLMCQTSCQNLQDSYTTIEIALNAAKYGDFCRDPYTENHVLETCLDYTDWCEVRLVNGTSFNVTCD
jgi:hypothetical protein